MANLSIIEKYLLIFCILIYEHQCLPETLSNNSTINSTIINVLRSPEGRIINGLFASRGQFPYQVYINADNILCGGSIINYNTVLTAAHCVFNKKNKLVSTKKTKVYAGDVYISSMKKFKVRKIIPHENYDPKKFDHDIAILKIKTKFWNGNPTSTIAPVSVTSLRFADNTDCIASGWGLTKPKGDASKNLMYTNLQIFNHKTCNIYYLNKITDSMICAFNTLTTVCSGDSGGPLIVKNQKTGNVPHLVGIVSFGVLDCPTAFPSVYTDTFKYKAWIERYANSHGISYQAISSVQFIPSILLSCLILFIKF